MADIKVKNAITGELIPVSDIELSETTNTDLIDELVNNNVFPQPPAGEKWVIVDKENIKREEDNMTLAAMGFIDGDTITIVRRPQGA